MPSILRGCYLGLFTVVIDQPLKGQPDLFTVVKSTTKQTARHTEEKDRELNMLRNIEAVTTVVFPVKSLDKGGIVPKSLIAARLLYHLSNIRAEEGFGYILAVTKLVSIGRGRPDPSSQYILFPVTFCCRTFLPKNGDIMIGTVYFVTKSGVFLKCGPMSHVYLSSRKMPNYSYVDGEKPFFLSNDQTRIEKDCVMRFRVFAVRWRRGDTSRQFKILVTIEDSSLGPIQSAGSDGMDLESPYPD